ncbi:hypothetical protein [Nocardia crassostreae]|uniref:hypothetical protein n=1 Tax=Nocardia crassostreae TaxID=53428 RepID=UPI00082F8099|nr:hypothetical protein [Nocardia crassostreae]
MHTIRSIAFATAVAGLLSGCSSLANQGVAEPVCSATFDLLNNAEVLGSGERFNAELERSKKRTEPFLMVEVTRAAGWSDDWDRLVEVQTNTTSGKLNKKAETASCWKNLPESHGDEYDPPEFYLFVKDGKPVQAVRWPSVVGVIRFGDHAAVTKESVMAIDDRGWVSAQP